jgi:hypothetical protein
MPPVEMVVAKLPLICIGCDVTMRSIKEKYAIETSKTALPRFQIEIVDIKQLGGNVGECSHQFVEGLWTTPGMGIDYERTEEVRDEIHSLRQLYPELNHWGDLALFMAWGSYSQDSHNLNWNPVADREVTFLAYLYYLEQDKNILNWSAQTAREALAELF